MTLQTGGQNPKTKGGGSGNEIVGLRSGSGALWKVGGGGWRRRKAVLSSVQTTGQGKRSYPGNPRFLEDYGPKDWGIGGGLRDGETTGKTLNGIGWQREIVPGGEGGG